MTDKLGEAIRWWDRMNDLEGQPVDWRPAIPVAFAVALAYSDGETIQWCKAHKSRRWEDAAICEALAGGLEPESPCRMVSRRLVVEIEED